MNLIKVLEIKTSLYLIKITLGNIFSIFNQALKKKSIDDREQFSSQNSPTTLMQDTKP